MNVLQYTTEEIAYVCSYNSDISLVLRPFRNETFKIVLNDADATPVGIIHWNRG
jgi:hypothetical protein